MPTYPVNRMGVRGGAARGFAQGAQQRFGNQLALRQTALAERGQQMQERQTKEQEDRIRHVANIAARQAAEALQFNYAQLDETSRNNWNNYVHNMTVAADKKVDDALMRENEAWEIEYNRQIQLGKSKDLVQKNYDTIVGNLDKNRDILAAHITVQDIIKERTIEQERLKQLGGVAQEETKGQYAIAGEEAKFGREVGLGERMYGMVQPGEQVTMGGVTVNRSRPPEAAQEKSRESNERDALAVWYYHQWWLPDEAKKRGVDPKTLSYQFADYTIGQKQLPNQQARQKAPMSWSQAYNYAKEYGLSKNLRGQELETMARGYANRLTGQQVQEPGTQPAAQPSAGFAMPAGPAGETQARPAAKMDLATFKARWKQMDPNSSEQAIEWVYRQSNAMQMLRSLGGQ